MMDAAEEIGHVVPCYGLLRRTLLPIYGLDQFIFVVVASVPFLWLGSLNPRLALFTGLGAYAGFVSTMQRSTPSSVLLPAQHERRVAAILDRSPFFERIGDSQWNSTKARLRRWDTDNIRVERNGQTLHVTGRQIDLQQLIALLSSNHS
jgi:hypothetical protein